MKGLHHIWRATKLSVLTVVFVVGYLVESLVYRDGRPSLLRWYLQACGAGYVKFGQILAMRFDLLPAEYCNELAKLLDEMPAFDMRAVRRTIQADLKRPLEQLFERFDAKPLGSASLAQVHRARLWTGEEVAVKIRRPRIEHDIAMDLHMLRAFAWVIDALGVALRVRLSGMVNSYARMALEELDFRREARNAQLLHERMEEDPIDHRAPRVYFDFSTERVLTMEFFEGVWVKELLAAVEAKDQRKLDAWAERGITPRRIARLLFRSIMEQCYHHRVFHADPHAANLVVLDGGTLAYIDFGMVGWLDEQLWGMQYRLFEAISREELHGAYEAMVDTLRPITVRDLSGFEAEFKTLLRDWIIASKSPHSSIEEKSTGRFILSASDAIRRARLQMPWTTMRLHRTTMISDMVELKLCPELDLNEEMYEFFRQDAGRQARSLVRAPLLVRGAYSLFQVMATTPITLQTVASWLQTRLPETFRDVSGDLTRWERIAGLFMRMLRLACWAVFFTFGVGSWVTLLAPENVGQEMATLLNLSKDHPSLWSLGISLSAALLGIFLGVAINWFEDSN